MTAHHPNTEPTRPASVPPRRGVVAVVERQERLLVIRRSRFVAAPGRLCFPGGGIEAGESEPEALTRELREELAVDIAPLHRLWHSLTPWNVALAWWAATFPAAAAIEPNPHEVEEVLWMTLPELRQSTELLESNHEFLDALARGEICLVPNQ